MFNDLKNFIMTYYKAILFTIIVAFSFMLIYLYIEPLKESLLDAFHDIDLIFETG